MLKSVLASPFTWLIFLALVAAILCSVGVYFEFGAGLSLICGGVFSLLYSAVIFKGIGNG